LPINSQSTRPETSAAPNPATLSTAVAALFPPGIAAAELRAPGDSSLLYPEEALSVANAVPKRRGEFAAGRLCARRALAEFGLSGFALKMAPDRVPLWPDSMVGSITHTQGFCAVVVAERRRFSALGLDVEAAGGVKRELWRHICGPAELHWLESLPPTSQASAATLIFSSKEAFYKCQYPLTRQRMNFADLCVTVPAGDARGGCGTGGQIIATPTRGLAISAGREARFHGTFRLHEGYVLAGFSFPAVASVIAPSAPAPRR
jgi:4'-phosphopantetheinyl transferase EntD